MGMVPTGPWELPEIVIRKIARPAAGLTDELVYAS